MTDRHTHNGTDSERIQAKNLVNAPQTALTTSVGGSLTSGGAAQLSTSDNAILTNAITRLNQLETKLKALGLLK